MKKIVLTAMLVACHSGCVPEDSARNSFASNPVAAGKADAKKIVGLYSMPSRLCTSPDTGSSCAATSTDCLRIEEDKSGYLVRLNSVQANQHVCAFSIHMVEEQGALLFKSSEGDVTIQRGSGGLKITSSGDPTALGLGFCGAYADIDGLVFPLSAKIDEAKSIQCSDDPE